MLAPYQDALIKFFRRLRWQGQKVPVISASPDRAHATMQRVLAARTASTSGRDVAAILKEMGEAAIPRPFISVWMDWAGYDPARFTTFVHRGIAIDEEKGIALSVQEPRPENFLVQADIWCGDDFHAAGQLVGQLKGMFIADDIGILVRFSEDKYYARPYDLPEHCRYMGDITCRLTDEGVTDNSQLTGDIGTMKDIRKTFTGTLYGWIPRVPFPVRLVKTLAYSVEDASEEPAVIIDNETTKFVV